MFADIFDIRSMGFKPKPLPEAYESFFAAHAGVSVEDATEHIWRQASPELFLLLTRQAGYDRVRYAEWLASTLSRLLL